MGTNLEEKSKSNDDKIIVKSQTYIEQALPLSNEETEENLEGEEIKNEEESPNKSITIGNLFGLTSGFSSANEAEEREKTKSTSLEDMYGMSSTFTQTDNTFMKDKSKNDKNHTKSQPYIEHTISIEDIIGLSSSFLPADNLHLPIKLETEDDRDKINHPSYFNEKKSEEEFPDRQITLGKLFGLSSSFSSEESVIEEGGNETPKSSIPSSKQKNIINSSSDSKDDSISIEDMFEMSSTIFPITDILVEGNNILKDEELHDRTFTVGNILGLSCSFSSVEESLIEDQDIGNASLMSSEEELPFLDALDTSGNSSVYSKEIKKEDIMKIESQKKNESKLKHRMKKKSPDLAGLLKKVFSPITKFVENSILEKNKISKNSKPKDSIVPENNKTAIYNIPTLKTMTSTYDTMNDSLSIEEIFGMSSTSSKAKSDTQLEEKSKSNKEESMEEEINIFTTHIPYTSYKINEDFNALTATTKNKDISLSSQKDDSNLVTFEQKIKKELNSEDGISIGEDNGESKNLTPYKTFVSKEEASSGEQNIAIPLAYEELSKEETNIADEGKKEEIVEEINDHNPLLSLHSGQTTDISET